MNIPYFDAHCDTAVPVHYCGGSLRENSFHIDLQRLGAYAPCAQVFSVCVRHGPSMGEETDKVLDTLLAEIAANGDRVRLCRSTVDITNTAAEGKIAALLSVEGMEKLSCSLTGLRRAYDKGVRIVHLTWNHDNALSGAAMDSGSGLTELGRDFVPAAQDMGVALDLSHLSERGFWETIEVAKKPVLAGHSDARALCDHPRNLTDEQFRALVKTGGAAGLNFCCDFLGHGRDVDAVAAHAEHYLSLGGEKALCLGGDLDGIPELPGGMEGVQSMEALYEAMLRRNWSEDLVRDIFWNNLFAFMERAL
ncbi:MAG: dipeptidase [Oscillospiraceae bacterium]